MDDLFNPQNVATLIICTVSAFTFYWFLWRPVTQRKASYYEFFKALDDVNATGWFKFRMLFKGMKMELWSNFLIILPAVIGLLTLVGSIPPTITAPFLPEYLQGIVPFVLSAVGAVTLYLNKLRSTSAGAPVPDAPTAIDVPTKAGSPDVVIVASASEGVHKIVPTGPQALPEHPDDPDEPAALPEELVVKKRRKARRPAKPVKLRRKAKKAAARRAKKRR